MKTAYLAGGWFTPAQQALKDAAYRALKQNPTLDWPHCFFPEQHLYRGWTMTDHPDLLAAPEWQLGTFTVDVQGINSADCVIALLDPKPQDADHGALWEMGYAYAAHKPVLLVTPAQPQADLNLMPALGATAQLALGELASYDFDAISYRPFQGRVF